MACWLAYPKPVMQADDDGTDLPTSTMDKYSIGYMKFDPNTWWRKIHWFVSISLGGKGMPEFCQVQMNQLQVEILDPQMVVPAEAIAFCLGQAAFDLGWSLGNCVNARGTQTKREAFTFGYTKPSIDGGPHKNVKPSRHEQTKSLKNRRVEILWQFWHKMMKAAW